VGNPISRGSDALRKPALQCIWLQEHWESHRKPNTRRLVDLARKLISRLDKKIPSAFKGPGKATCEKFKAPFCP